MERKIKIYIDEIKSIFTKYNRPDISTFLEKSILYNQKSITEASSKIVEEGYYKEDEAIYCACQEVCRSCLADHYGNKITNELMSIIDKKIQPIYLKKCQNIKSRKK